MDQTKLFQDFACSVRCESKNTVVFVACPKGGRYGDVRKTLAGLLQRPFNSVHVAPPVGDFAVPLDDDQVVEPTENEVIVPARILKATEQGGWEFE
ncbi:hypothetical protein GH5_02871 [Leishmania sp. Ghana 2012 LV757]|uniref:Uncharacterized protein n=1 Tax=Leishmania orientalis TaxID=2249476 RepID=A0A836GFY3_9TRYP|nr:hypothetical protein LSCM4_02229 [Leishmania orientalis]KAG5498074.1 hypothetical protein GH5_02871 [Leishmania sp. Ghana 2012 LV757]